MSPKEQPALSTEPFLRSINICYDAESAERISHFRPTSKCVTLLRALLADDGEKAFLVIAPYGTGKSLTIAYLLHLIENREESRQSLKEIEKRLAEVSPELASVASGRRRSSRRHGLVVALQGAHEHVPLALKAAAIEAMRRLRLGRQARPLQAIEVNTIDDALRFLSELTQRCRDLGYDRILIAWDEFGRHVESLVSNGRASQLAEVQQLAEFAARAKEPSVAIALLMHQGLLHYGSNVPQSVRNEWKKIEGRFNQIQYVDDSKEIYRLIATIVRGSNGAAVHKPANAIVLAKKLHANGLFKDFSETDLKDLIAASYPLETITLFLLPRIASRVAQNERTLFSFLHAADLSAPVPPTAIYDYFSSAMRADTSVGGTHRRWLETESAISKAQSTEEVAALKTVCLLGLGASGERAQTSLPLLALAIDGTALTDLESQACIRTLIERKLLLHRRHNDEVSVWHGSTNKNAALVKASTSSVSLQKRVRHQYGSLRNTMTTFAFDDTSRANTNRLDGLIRSCVGTSLLKACPMTATERSFFSLPNQPTILLRQRTLPETGFRMKDCSLRYRDPHCVSMMPPLKSPASPGCSMMHSC